jgi:diguanylate cyclase (GGDEF)-like protein
MATTTHKPKAAINLLLIEDRPERAELIRKIFAEESDLLFHIESEEKLSSGLQRLEKGRTDLVLLDLSLPDSKGMETFVRLQSQAPAMPVVILGRSPNEPVALEVLRRGAQDFVVTEELSGRFLSHILRHAIERHKLHESLRNQSLMDELTGLYNRRGFFAVANQHLLLAERGKRELLLILSDLDGMKTINDRFGHQEGDRALQKAAEILKGSFRKSDIAARIGGDEFAVIALDAGEEHAQILTGRLQENLDAWNSPGKRYYLSLSIGVACYRPENGNKMDLPTIISRADQALYAHKRIKREKMPSGLRT